MTETKQIPLQLLLNNEGQIEGVPRNPRQITEENYKKLVKSLKEDNLTDLKPLLVYPYGEQYVVLGGNMRLRALQEIGVESVSCIIAPIETKKKQLCKVVILDNNEFGEYDWDLIANEWNEYPLDEWGCMLPVYAEPVDIEAMIDTASSDAAIKEYSDDTSYDLTKLYRAKCNEEITSKIEQGIKDGKIRGEIAEVLKCRVMQCTILNFDEIIKYYRSKDATEEERELLKRLYLVFVTPRELFESEILKFKAGAERLFDDNLMQRQDETQAD